MASPDFRKSDRWITPAVIIAFVIVGGVVACVLAASVAYLTARGIDPDPMIKLVTTTLAALGSLATFVMQLVNRSTTAKVERNTGTLPDVITDAVTGAVTAALPPAPPAPDPVTGYAGSSLPPVPTGYAR
jgi:hypothetical protein